jgi:hypothetical protein
MKYLCLLYVSEATAPAPGSPAFAELVAANVDLTREMRAAGVLVDSAPLQPVSAATTLRVREGETLLTDGPYAELKEQLGGYYLLDCAELDEALAWAAKIPAARNGTVEVRPLIAMEQPA